MINLNIKYVFDGVTKHLHMLRRKAWATKHGTIWDADIWRQVDALIASRTSESFQITKVEGHATMADVNAGRTTRMNKMGNDEADA